MDHLTTRSLHYFGIVVLAGIIYRAWRHVSYLRRRHAGLVVWRRGTPAGYAMMLTCGILCALLSVFNLFVLRRGLFDVFGVAMLAVYYGLVVPLSTLAYDGLYRDGILSERGFLPYRAIGALTWREAKADNDPVLLLAKRGTRRALTLTVPLARLGETRRALRDLITADTITLLEPTLTLDRHDPRDDV